jgi:hypothetical protein
VHFPTKNKNQVNNQAERHQQLVSAMKASKKQDKEAPSLTEEKKDGSDADSVSSAAETKTSKATNWLGKEVKRPRAEYQAEIDELKLKLAEVRVDLENKTVELQQFKDWVGMAPSAF